MGAAIKRSAHVVTAVEEEDELDVSFAVHDLGPSLKVVFIPRKAVDEEAKFFLVRLHRLLHRLDDEKPWVRCSCHPSEQTLGVIPNQKCMSDLIY